MRIPMLGILCFEGRYQIGRLTFAAAAASFAFLGFAFAATAFGPDDVPLNAPTSIAQSLGLLSLVAVFATTLFCVQAALRDGEHRMAEIVYTTAITKAQYVLGRFAGALGAACAAFAFALPGLLLGTFAVAHDPARVGPFSLLAYLWPLVLLALPNLLFLTAVLYAVASLSRSTIATYVGGVLLYMLYFASALVTGSPLMAASTPPSAATMARAALADPFGLSALFAQTRYWTALERTERLLPASGALLTNRLLWIAVSLLLLALVYRRFAFRLPAGEKTGRRHAVGATTGADASPAVAYRPTKVDWRSSAAWRACLAVTRSDLRHAVRGWPLLALLAGWIGTVAMTLFEGFRRAESGSALLPTTGQVIGELQAPLALFALLLLVYSAAELVWRERTVGMAEIVDATPAPSGAFLAAKIATLALLVALLTASAVAVAIVFQRLFGVTALEPALYASLFYFTGLPLLLVAILAVLIQTVAPNRHAGMLLTLMVAGVWHRGALGGPVHPLLRYAAAPAVPSSALAGFGPQALSFGWFMAYWSAFAALLALLAGGLWRRGTEGQLPQRLAALRRRWVQAGTGVRGATVVCAFAWLGLGGLVFHQTDRLNDNRSPEEILAWRAAYERTYRPLERAAQPTLLAITTRVDLYPRERRYRARGSYLLENRAAVPLSTVWVTVRRDLTRARLTLAGRPPNATDPRFGAAAFALTPPLAPGARIELGFDLAVRRRGATTGDVDYGILRNGSLLFSNAFLPVLGYRRSYEITDLDERRRQGLAATSRPTTLEAAEADGLSSGAETRVAFDATVSTEGDQIALAPGRLLGSSRRNGRRTFHYRTEEPIRPIFAVASARYTVNRAREAGVDIEVYSHPEHGRNVERMLAAARQALRYGLAQFGPYPHGALRIVEVPAFWQRFGGYAMPGTVFLVEDRGFLTDASDPARVDVVSRRIAHEVAHQWFGHRLAPALLPGASALVETPARYSEMRVLAALHGEAAVPPVLAYELDRYLRGRTGGDEVPLERVENQAYLYYAKGGLVLAAVRDLLGEARTNRALRQLVDHADRLPPPNARDLVTELERGASEPQRTLLEQWWRRIVLYDLRVAGARATPLPGGRYRLTVRLEATKVEIRGRRETALPFDEELELAVYAEDPGLAGAARPEIARVRRRVGAATELALVVAERPRFVVLDPGFLRLDRNRADNVLPVTESASPPTTPSAGGDLGQTKGRDVR